MKYSKRLAEIIFGAVILLIAATFIFYGLIKVVDKKRSFYVVKAKFNEVGGLAAGTQVIIKGVVIGSVKKIVIDDNYNIDIYLHIEKNIKLPVDSTVYIKDISLFSGRKVEIEPGRSQVYIEDGGRLRYTVDYMYLEDKISSTFFNKGK